ncbi:MAG: hypothetical protein NTZ42_02135 [Candidatus Gribaldobacteria bacterium]|nr:hypothetical protein [Candidatus Gribaldobacteria bacterium]
MVMKIVLVTILAVLAVALAGVLGWQKLSQPGTTPIVVNQPIANEPVVNKPVVQPQDETSGWKTYKNKKYGYSIGYLNTWNIEEVSANITDIRNWQRKAGEYSNPLEDIEIRVLPGETYESDAYTGRLSGGFVINIGGQYEGKEFYTVSSTDASSFGYYIVMLEHDNNLYEITIYKGNPNYGIFKDKMLSTFKFIK